LIISLLVNMEVGLPFALKQALFSYFGLFGLKQA